MHIDKILVFSILSQTIKVKRVRTKNILGETLEFVLGYASMNYSVGCERDLDS